jgi:hypothetical protein
MGYTTDFSGALDISPVIKPEHVAYINKFNETRRMRFDAKKAAQMPDPEREAVGLPIGEDGEFFTGNPGSFGQDHGDYILDYNSPPGCHEQYGFYKNGAGGKQPGLWCQWRVDGNKLVWDGGEKFYDYVEWLNYLIAKFFKPWGYTLNGEIKWFGEDSSDLGIIVVVNNEVSVQKGHIEYR